MNPVSRVASLLFLGLALAACAGMNSEELSATDRVFLNKAAEAGIGEVELGRIAMQRSSTPAVQGFAAHMVGAHSDSNQQLLSMAKDLGVAVPTHLSLEQQRIREQLLNLSGSEFDRLYMTSQINAHQEAITIFQNEATNGQVGELRDFANKLLPTLQTHLQAAQTVATTPGNVRPSSFER